jgi:hypothetical protein
MATEIKELLSLLTAKEIQTLFTNELEELNAVVDEQKKEHSENIGIVMLKHIHKGLETLTKDLTDFSDKINEIPTEETLNIDGLLKDYNNFKTVFANHYIDAQLAQSMEHDYEKSGKTFTYSAITAIESQFNKLFTLQRTPRGTAYETYTKGMQKMIGEATRLISQGKYEVAYKNMKSLALADKKYQIEINKKESSKLFNDDKMLQGIMEKTSKTLVDLYDKAKQRSINDTKHRNFILIINAADRKTLDETLLNTLISENDIERAKKVKTLSSIDTYRLIDKLKTFVSESKSPTLKAVIEQCNEILTQSMNQVTDYRLSGDFTSAKIELSRMQQSYEDFKSLFSEFTIEENVLLDSVEGKNLDLLKNDMEHSDTVIKHHDEFEAFVQKRALESLTRKEVTTRLRSNIKKLVEIRSSLEAKIKDFSDALSNETKTDESRKRYSRAKVTTEELNQKLTKEISTFSEAVNKLEEGIKDNLSDKEMDELLTASKHFAYNCKLYILNAKPVLNEYRGITAWLSDKIDNFIRVFITLKEPYFKNSKFNIFQPSKTDTTRIAESLEREIDNLKIGPP